MPVNIKSEILAVSVFVHRPEVRRIENFNVRLIISITKREYMELSKLTKTKIVATVGPACSDYKMISELIKAGVAMFRLNTSHGDIETHKEYISIIKEAGKNLNRYIPVLVDLQGPKIRVGNMDKPVRICKGMEIILTPNDDYDRKTEVPTDYKEIAKDIKIGEKILLDDGKIGLEAVRIIDGKVKTKVIYGKEIKPRKGINIPSNAGSLAAVTQRDIKFIKFAIENDADYIALSFVRNENDIKLAKKYLEEFHGSIPIIAKIEKPQAIENLDSIIKISDGIMVARGDLGIELSPEDVPIVQKNIIYKALKARKVCIVATQMLESMIEEPVPTRAEASDVANAILDGTDAIMLSGETASGKYPVQAVKMMKKIAKNVEETYLCKKCLELEINNDYALSPQAIAQAAVKMAKDLDAKAVLAFSHMGYTPRLISKIKPSVPVIAISNLESTCKKLNLYWGIYSCLKDWDTVLDGNLLEMIDNYILNNTEIKKDERIIILGSIPKLITGRTNFIRIHRIGAPLES